MKNYHHECGHLKQKVPLHLKKDEVVILNNIMILASITYISTRQIYMRHGFR